MTRIRDERWVTRLSKKTQTKTKGDLLLLTNYSMSSVKNEFSEDKEVFNND